MNLYFSKDYTQHIKEGSILRLGRYVLPTSGKPYDLDIKIYKDLGKLLCQEGDSPEVLRGMLYRQGEAPDSACEDFYRR